jgi:hypothetical protein
LQQRHVVITEAAAAIGRERIDGAGALRRVAVLAEAEELREIVGRALAEEFIQDDKIALLGSRIEAPAHGRIVLAGIRPADQIVQRAAEPLRIAQIAACMLLRLNGVEVAPPQIAVGAPMRMQSLHAGLRAPKRHAMDHQPLAITIEQLIRTRTTQPLVNRPYMRIDDVAAERSVE